jgi:hypothetical protein
MSDRMFRSLCFRGGAHERSFLTSRSRPPTDDGSIYLVLTEMFSVKSV